MRTKTGNKGQDILNAAIRIFAIQGYHKAKIFQIAQEAGVSSGSVYVYYENKEDILLQIFDKLWKNLFNELCNIYKSSELSPLEKLEATIDLIMDLYTDTPDLALVLVNEQNYLMRTNKKFTSYYNKFFELSEDILKFGISKGSFNSYLEPGLLRLYIFGAIKLMVSSWAQSPEEFPISKIRRTIKLMLKHGIVK